MCQPNSCVGVLQRLREGWQMCKMQTLKPLKRNSNTTLLYLLVPLVSETAGSLSRNSLHFRRAPEPFWLLQSFVHCSNSRGQEEPLVLPALPRQGLSLLRSTLALPKAQEVCVSGQESGKGKDGRKHERASHTSSRRVPLQVCRHMGWAHTGKPEPPSAACQQTQLDLSISCCSYPAATASKHFCATAGTAHTPSF